MPIQNIMSVDGELLDFVEEISDWIKILPLKEKQEFKDIEEIVYQILVKDKSFDYHTLEVLLDAHLILIKKLLINEN